MNAKPADESSSARGDLDAPSDQSDAAEMFRQAYDTLHNLAAGYLRQERPDHTLQPTALVHEAFMKLNKGANNDFQDRNHFQAVAARAMRQILVDHARRRNMQKRGGEWQRVTVDVGILGKPCNIDFLAVEDALQLLAGEDERKAQVVELRFFGGMTIPEAARNLGISPKTAEADWYFARAWLRKKLADADTQT